MYEIFVDFVWNIMDVKNWVLDQRLLVDKVLWIFNGKAIMNENNLGFY